MASSRSGSRDPAFQGAQLCPGQRALLRLLLCPIRQHGADSPGAAVALWLYGHRRWPGARPRRLRDRIDGPGRGSTDSENRREEADPSGLNLRWAGDVAFFLARSRSDYRAYALARALQGV